MHFGTTDLSLRFKFDLYEDCVLRLFFLYFFKCFLFDRRVIFFFILSIIIHGRQINQCKMVNRKYDVRDLKQITIKEINRFRL